jgi:peptidoglycan L-alanyl-D-glutamate endopeptidase CwlK
MATKSGGARRTQQQTTGQGKQPVGTLRRGATGVEVAKLQTRLKERGFDPGSIDGDFGGGTEAAVLAFQKSEGLVADGVVGARTWVALGLPGTVDIPNAIPGITVAAVSQMFPHTPVGNIKRNLPPVLSALADARLMDKPMVLMALATIRAETESFEPVAEGCSRFNTSPNGHRFDLYDRRRDLGNTGKPDGERFCGRGYIQLTGRHNYGHYGKMIGLGNELLKTPELASDPAVAGKLLAAFLADKEVRIRQALVDGDLAGARRLVNGGSHGLDRFTEAYVIGERVIA